MCRAVPTDKSPNRSDRDKVPRGQNPIGQIFRDYGEQCIKVYPSPKQHIKLIRSMRMCKSPAMGGKAYICANCGVVKYVYFGCGQSHCSICQSVKREQWMIKMGRELLVVPYVHLITTLPHQLNSLARANPRQMYNLMLQATNQVVQELAKNPKHLGAKPGLISVLHTFGSDMKYHNLSSKAGYLYIH